MTNQLLIQYFHWYYNEEQLLWEKVKNDAGWLASLGVTQVWLPPTYKGREGANCIGYEPYDLFDVGEFDQKGSVATRYGVREQYEAAVAELRSNGIGAVADVVFNHKAGGDELERVTVKRVDPGNREAFTSDAFEIDAWTRFTFPGRKGKHSEFIWDFHCFSGVDWAEDLQESAIFSIQNQYGEGWEPVPSTENGNYDFLMFNDIDFRNTSVREELKYWGKWYLESFQPTGFRLDAVKHINIDFVNDWVDHMNAVSEKPLFFVAENWSVESLQALEDYLDATGSRVQLFDSMLHHNLYQASVQGEAYDLSRILDNTLVSSRPERAVTFVDNHDTQPLQSLESYVDFWFRPLAYALILLREQGIPCLFFPDLYGAIYHDAGAEGEEHEIILAKVEELPVLARLRKELGHGLQRDYFDFPSCIGWTREGSAEYPNSGFAVVMSNGTEGFKDMEMGPGLAGKVMVDALGKREGEVVINETGWGNFHCAAGSVSVWILKDAAMALQLE
ncbi:alpha-amylase [Pedobacter yulinensis]|uniref:Alpha-amylase n=1 Tax=Pedobacter yulinensis TaxID=2126353 RepID=A0A2T3HHV1_9SPHI|nr:alpha-amylase [Pedobacter yulinensis]PST82019.1 alpha-amylase [Pedobacter yulinensis]